MRHSQWINQGNRFAYRGFMMDVSRHFYSITDVKRLIEAAALNGANVFHWHLMDDHGWRIEIKRYPELTEVASHRPASHFGQIPAEENNSGYYTQDEVREIVAFAAEHGITVIPEMEVPGHQTALLAAMPQYGCRRMYVDDTGCVSIEDQPYEYEVLRSGGIFPNLLCAGKDETLEMIRHIIDEIVELFPGPAVHIGGDEALKLHWRRCPDCQKRIRELGLKGVDDLQRWLVLQTGEYLAQKGKDAIVWNESLEGGMLPDYFIVQHWLGNDQETRQFAQAGGRVIVSDRIPYYLDMPFYINDVRKLLAYSTVPAYLEGCKDSMIGIEAPLWTERVTNMEKAARMIYPRLSVALRKANGITAESLEAFRADYLASIQPGLKALGLEDAPESLWSLDETGMDADKKAYEAECDEPVQNEVERLVQMMIEQDVFERWLEARGMVPDRVWIISDAMYPELRLDGPIADEATQAEAEALHRVFIAGEHEGAWPAPEATMD